MPSADPTAVPEDPERDPWGSYMRRALAWLGARPEGQDPPRHEPDAPPDAPDTRPPDED